MPKELSPEANSLITGCLLGDGFIPATKGRYHSFGFEQSSEKEEYVGHVFSLLKDFTNRTSIKTALHDKRKWGKGIYQSKRFKTCRHPIFSDLRKCWYNEEGIKIVPANLRLDWQAVAYWFADDGHNRKNGKELVLCSESFTEAENNNLIALLNKHIGISASITHRSGGSGVGIRILSSDYFKFIDGIYPYLNKINCFKHKLDISNATKNTTPRYPEKIKKEIVQMWLSGHTQVEISKQFGCHKQTVYRIIKEHNE